MDMRIRFPFIPSKGLHHRTMGSNNRRSRLTWTIGSGNLSRLDQLGLNYTERAADGLIGPP